MLHYCYEGVLIAISICVSSLLINRSGLCQARLQMLDDRHNIYMSYFTYTNIAGSQLSYRAIPNNGEQ